MQNKKPIIIIAVLSVMALGLGYWYGLPEEGSGRGKEAAVKAAAVKAAAEKAAAEKEKRRRRGEERRNARAKLLRWEFETGGQVSSSPAIGSDGTVYVVAAGFFSNSDRKLYAINGKSGGKLWEFETGTQVHSSPAIGSDGTVYVGSYDNYLYAINGKSGVKLWEFETGGSVYSSPAIGPDGTVYVGSRDGKLYAISGKTGVKLWEFESGESEYGVRSSPAIGSDGTVYVGSRDIVRRRTGKKEFVYTGGVKKLYAIKTESLGLAKSPWPMRGQNARHTGRVMKK